MSDVLFKDKSGTFAYTTDRASQIMDGLLLEQYQNSPNLREYMMAFVGEMDYLFEQTERVYWGRLIEYATGTQLDYIGEILQQVRTIDLPIVKFAFDGAAGAIDGFGSSTNPDAGGYFQGAGSAGFNVTPLEDPVYRKVLMAKAMSLVHDTCDINHAYDIIKVLLDKVPTKLQLETVSPREISLELEGVSSYTKSVIDYCAKYFVPTGVTFSIT